jgi:uncharacterized protein (DUF1778 family)
MENTNSTQMTNINMRVTFQEKSLLSGQAQANNIDLTNFIKAELFEELPRLKAYESSTRSREERFKEMEQELRSKSEQIKDLENSLSQYDSMPLLNQLYKDAVGKICQVGNFKFEINTKQDLIRALVLNYQTETIK